MAAPRNNGPLRIICVARLIERKGQRHLLAALRRLRDAGVTATVEFVGTGDAAQAYRAEANRLGIADQVTFAGYVPREQIADHYAAADVFVLPSYNEGMSVATLEAMAAGLPLVVTRTGGTAELVQEGENGLTFAWGDVETLVQHLAYLAANREVVQQMGAASRRRAERMSWEAVAARYLEIFDRMLNQGVHGTACMVESPQDHDARRDEDDGDYSGDRAGGGPDQTAAGGVSAGL
jgi:glycosyltransferase involved in cell wall biosynthesis